MVNVKSFSYNWFVCPVGTSSNVNIKIHKDHAANNKDTYKSQKHDTIGPKSWEIPKVEANRSSWESMNRQKSDTLQIKDASSSSTWSDLVNGINFWLSVLQQTIDVFNSACSLVSSNLYDLWRSNENNHGILEGSLGYTHIYWIINKSRSLLAVD